MKFGKIEEQRQEIERLNNIINEFKGGDDIVNN